MLRDFQHWSCLDKTPKDWPIFKIYSFLSIHEPGLYVVPKWQRWHPLVSSMTGDMGDIRMVTWGGVRSVTMEMEADAPCPTLLRATQLYSPGPVTLMFLGKRKMFLLLINFRLVLSKCIVEETSRKWLTVAIFRKWQDSIVASWIDIAVILWWTFMDYYGGGSWLAWMTGIDDWHGWLAWMTGMVID